MRPPADEHDMFAAAQRWLEEGRQVALATVVETWGSSPQPPGSFMVMDGSSNMLGSVSGGCIEGAVVAEAQGVLKSGRPKLLEYGVSDERAWEVRLEGGQIRLGCRSPRSRQLPPMPSAWTWHTS